VSTDPSEAMCSAWTLSGHATGLHQAGLKAVTLLSEADEHVVA
jgi:hypothetical protein